MTPDDMRTFLDGLLTAWDADGLVTAAETSDGVTGRIERSGAPTVAVARRNLAFGIVWEVQADGARARAHPSAQGAIRSLGALLAPVRPRGRVVFASGRDSAA